MSYSLLINGARVRFATHAPALLGSRFDDMTVQGTINFNLASRMRDVVPLHNSVLSQLPSGTPANAKDLNYVAFINNVTEEEVIFATAWIDENSIEALSSAGLTITVSNTGVGDLDRIRSMLLEAGFNDLEFTVN